MNNKVEKKTQGDRCSCGSRWDANGQCAWLHKTPPVADVRRCASCKAPLDADGWCPEFKKELAQARERREREEKARQDAEATDAPLCVVCDAPMNADGECSRLRGAIDSQKEREQKIARCSDCGGPLDADGTCPALAAAEKIAAAWKKEDGDEDAAQRDSVPAESARANGGQFVQARTVIAPQSEAWQALEALAVIIRPFNGDEKVTAAHLPITDNLVHKTFSGVSPYVIEMDDIHIFPFRQVQVVFSDQSRLAYVFLGMVDNIPYSVWCPIVTTAESPT